MKTQAGGISKKTLKRVRIVLWSAIAATWAVGAVLTVQVYRGQADAGHPWRVSTGFARQAGAFPPNPVTLPSARPPTAQPHRTTP